MGPIVFKITTPRRITSSSFGCNNQGSDGTIYHLTTTRGLSNGLRNEINRLGSSRGNVFSITKTSVKKVARHVTSLFEIHCVHNVIYPLVEKMLVGKRLRVDEIWGAKDEIASRTVKAQRAGSCCIDFGLIIGKWEGCLIWEIHVDRSKDYKVGIKANRSTIH